uniref:NADH:ubiquinone reductase (H(+)-translocating) n=1 Tax=Trichuris trichiura TaxID=36087 RepID=A0A0M5M1Y3_TRITR|nr:NADH dehydrogenase subunit 5 [Trichuris trichiura]
MIIAVAMCLSVLLCISLMLFMLKGSISFLTMGIDNFIVGMSLCELSKLMVYFSLVVVLLSVFIMYFSFFYMNNDLPIPRFMMLMVIFVASMIIMNSSDSCWITWIGWEGLGVSSYLLIMFYNNWKANNSAISTILLNRIGDFCLLICMLTFTQSMQWEFNNTSMTSYLLMLTGIAALAKSAQIPLHSWLPIAMAAPTPVSSLVHSSTLVVAGTILCIKLNLLYFLPYMGWLCITGYLTSLYSSFMALYEKDLKKILAYSTMSQIALVMFMICTNLKELMLMHIINHALVKALLFMSIGIFIIFMFGNQDSRLLHTNSSLFSILVISIVCLLIMCGVTFTSSYYSKEYNLLFSMKEESMTLLIDLMVFMSFAYSVRLSYLLFRSYNNNITSSKMLYPSLYTNILLLPLALLNGWIFMSNYSLPINMTWMDNKNFMLVTPLIMLTFFYQWVCMQAMNNNDTLYSLLNSLPLSIKNLVFNQMKLINMSFNLNMFSFNNSSLILWLLGTTLLMLTMSFLYFS